MAKSSIVIDVELDENRVPSNIEWKATDNQDRTQNARALILSLWDGSEKTAMRIDLWTQKMMVDEMADFYYQTFMTMADTFERATKKTELVQDIRDFAVVFHKKFVEIQKKENSAQ